MIAKQTALPWHTENPPQNWASPQWIVDDCDRRFAGEDGFMLDVSAEAWNAKAPFYFDAELDALTRDWWLTEEARVLGDAEPIRPAFLRNRSIAAWMNPPYEDIEPWVRKAHAEVDRGTLRLVCSLLPARVDQTWWQDVVKPFAWHIEFVDGRVAFDPPPGVEARTPFEASAIVVFQKRISARR